MDTKTIGFVGLGKLGLPCAAAMSVKAGVEVIGFDLNPDVKNYVLNARIPYLEKECENYLEQANIKIVESPKLVVERSEILFVAVQTPHEPQFEGTTPVSEDLADFDYVPLVKAIRSIAEILRELPDKKLTIVVISTVLPGTMRNLILPELAEFSDRVSFCYNPFFIAMGQTISDFLNPEFVLIGSDDQIAARNLAKFYSQIHNAEFQIMSIESAELTKVAYNTFIGFKIVFANTLREITQVRGGNVDEVTSALSKAKDRLISGKYLRAGMGDGGGCHPRDQIAMSWLAKNASLSSDIFGFLARARDAQSLRQSIEIEELALKNSLPITILGLAYKPDINLTVGSPSLLLINQLKSRNVSFNVYDPMVNVDEILPDYPQLFFVATNHSVFKNLTLPKNSIVIDPWGDAIKEQDGVEVIRPGR